MTDIALAAVRSDRMEASQIGCVDLPNPNQESLAMTFIPLTRAVPLLFTLLAMSAVAADRPASVLVVNGATSAVPVLVTNAQAAAAIPQTVYTDLFSTTTAAVMTAPGTGKKFIVKNVTMYLATNNSAVNLQDANCVLSLRQGSLSFAVATFSLQHADLLLSMGLSQGTYLVLGPNDALDMNCVSNPAGSSGRVSISGELVTAP